MRKPRVPFHVDFLRDELRRRQQKNRSYSLRAFAKFLCLDPAALSRILNQKQELSPQTCLAIIKKLHLNENQRRLFFTSIAKEKTRRTTRALVNAIVPSSGTGDTDINGEAVIADDDENGGSATRNADLVEIRANYEREKAARLQAEGEHMLLRSLTDSMPYLVWRVTAQGEVIYGNRRWAWIFGHVPSPEKSSHWFSLIHPDDENGHRQDWQTAMENGHPFKAEYRILRHDGTFLQCIGHHSPIVEENGHISDWACTAYEKPADTPTSEKKRRRTR